MTIFLTSSPSGPLDNSRPVDGLDTMNFFRENLHAYWKPQSRCLMITADPDNYGANDEMTAFFADAFARADLSWSSFDLWDGRTKNFSRKSLHSYDVILLGGGHVPTQNVFLNQISLPDHIWDFPGLVIGISAGTMNSASTVYAQPELPGESVDPEYVRYLPGLGLTETMILPHYQMVKDYLLDDRRLFEDITYADSYNKRFLALTDGSYLPIADGTETVWGEAYEISDGILRLICETDHHITWK